MTKDQLLQAFAEAYEQIIAAATVADQSNVTRPADVWGIHDIVAHLAGWEIMATVRIPKIVAGLPPSEFGDAAQTAVMNDAINTAFVTLSQGQTLAALCDSLRQAYQRNVTQLSLVDAARFQPGAYVYERTKDAIEHCHEHMDQIAAMREA